MDNNGPFGIDPDEFDRVVRETGEGLRSAFEQVGRFFNSSPERAGFGVLFDQFVRPTPKGRAARRPRAKPGDGVWAIYISDADGKAHVEQVYKDRARRAARQQAQHRSNRNVRFLPYGIGVSVLDAAEKEAKNRATTRVTQLVMARHWSPSSRPVRRYGRCRRWPSGSGVKTGSQPADRSGSVRRLPV